MARLLEIRGLSEAVAGAKKGISDLKVSAGKLNDSTSRLVAEIADLTDQVEQHREDLRFEADSLGNGSDKPRQQSAEPLHE